MLPSRHIRFLIAIGAGVAAYPLIVWTGVSSSALRLLMSVNAFFLVYLVLTGALLGEASASELQARSRADDEGLALILVVTVVAVAVSLGAVFVLIRGHDGRSDLLAVAGVPLGWLTLHTLFAFHYARLFYGDDEAAGNGLDFPGTSEPGPWEFLYFSFVIGMTAQVSDVTIRTTPLRKAALVHGTISFFYNAVILALAVNAALSFAG